MVGTAPVYGIIFDLMGTLATFTGTREELHAAWQRGAAELYRHLRATGVAIAADDFARALQTTFEADLAHNGGNPRELSVESVMTRVLDDFGYHLTPEANAAAQRAYFMPELDGWRILPGALEAVEALNTEGFRLAVISNAPSHLFVEEAVAKIGLRPFFSPVMSSALAGARKPDAGLFLTVASAWELDPATIVVIGDGLRADIEGAHAAGMRGILVHGAANPDNAAYTGTALPDATLISIIESPTLIEAWHAASGDDARPETGFIEDF
ncbi:MAG TPA: HAD family hydrolase [Thermomicrobiales bacterium]|jgi:putative hydrolase of the HAD superfamily